MRNLLSKVNFVKLGILLVTSTAAIIAMGFLAPDSETMDDEYITIDEEVTEVSVEDVLPPTLKKPRTKTAA